MDYREEIKQLRDTLNEHGYRYYVLDAPSISDYEYDMLNRRLEELEAEAEKRREAMVEAKKETSSIEKLKEKKLEAYHKEEAKSEELFIEEFVSSTRAHAAS